MSFARYPFPYRRPASHRHRQPNLLRTHHHTPIFDFSSLYASLPSTGNDQPSPKDDDKAVTQPEIHLADAEAKHLEEEESGEWKSCAICLEDTDDPKTCTLFPGCVHVYHKNCLLSWLSRKRACPQCGFPFNECITESILLKDAIHAILLLEDPTYNSSSSSISSSGTEEEDLPGPHVTEFSEAQITLVMEQADVNRNAALAALKHAADSGHEARWHTREAIWHARENRRHDVRFLMNSVEVNEDQATEALRQWNENVFDALHHLRTSS